MKLRYATKDSVALYSNAQMADLDGDGNVELIALSRVGLQTGCPPKFKRFVDFEGTTGKIIRKITTPYISYDGMHTDGHWRLGW